MKALDYDSLMNFLAGHRPQAILNLCKQPQNLERQMLQMAQREESEVEPDSQEAFEAAQASSESETQAEMLAGWLRWKDQQAWRTLAQTAVKASQGNLTLSDLERINGSPIPDPDEEEIPEMWQEWEQDASARW